MSKEELWTVRSLGSLNKNDSNLLSSWRIIDGSNPHWCICPPKFLENFNTLEHELCLNHFQPIQSYRFCFYWNLTYVFWLNLKLIRRYDAWYNMYLSILTGAWHRKLHVPEKRNIQLENICISFSKTLPKRPLIKSAHLWNAYQNRISISPTWNKVQICTWLFWLTPNGGGYCIEKGTRWSNFEMIKFRCLYLYIQNACKTMVYCIKWPVSLYH